ncbi:MAG: PspA-associated protein PspAA [Dehalococcoidia bacterium]
MIVRILGDQQYRLDADIMTQLEALDLELDQDLEQDTPTEFAGHLSEMLRIVREHGLPLSDDEIVPSDAILPADDSSLGEIRALLGGAGLAPALAGG